jgi:hypothetical protein
VQVACLIANLAKCIVQSALIAEMNVKFRSNLIPADQSIVEIVGQKEDGHVASVTKRLRERTVLTIFYFFSYCLATKNVFFSFFQFDEPEFLVSSRSDAPWIKVIR